MLALCSLVSFYLVNFLASLACVCVSYRLIREQFIRAKYEREEFTDLAKQQAYRSAVKRGVLWKRAKDNNSFNPRYFQLSEHDNTLSYFLKDDVSMHMYLYLQKHTLEISLLLLTHPTYHPLPL